MTKPAGHTKAPSAIGLRAGKGGAVAVAVLVADGMPRLIASTFIATHESGDNIALAPYRVATEMARASQGDMASAAHVVSEGRRRQDHLAGNGLRALIAQLERHGNEPTVVSLLVNRAGWVTDLLSYSLAWAEHVPVAEGLAVREAFRRAIDQCGIDATEQDEKSLRADARHALGILDAAIDAQVKIMGASAGKPWRKEQKLACLAAWVAITGRT